MLIQKGPSQNDIVAIRLVTGEEVIGRLAENPVGANVRLAKPVAVQMQMVGPGQAGIGFAPYFISVDETVQIVFPTDKIVVGPVVVKQEMAAAYMRSTTGLAMPSGPAPSLLGG